MLNAIFVVYKTAAYVEIYKYASYGHL